MWTKKRRNEGRRTRRSSSNMLGLAAAGLLSVGAVGQSADAQAQTVHRRGATPDYHVVASGDTMWDLSGSYYGDNYMWPRMWAYNAHVTNPHWIYPGDIVYLKTPKSGEAPADVPAQVASQTGNLNLPPVGFITSESLEYAGRITASPKEATMISPLDTVWIGLGEEAYTEEEIDELDEDERRKMAAVKPAVGDTYAVVRESGSIENDDGDIVGYKYHLIGSLKITEVSEKYYETAEVQKTWREMYRGDYLIPFERQLKVTSPVQSDKDMVAEIVDSMANIRFFGEQHYVFVNKGAENGVRPGNRFFVYQKQEGLDFPGDDTAEEVPWRRVGQLMLIDVRKNYSLAVITNSTKEIVKGDRLEMYQGY